VTGPGSSEFEGVGVRWGICYDDMECPVSSKQPLSKCTGAFKYKYII